MDSQYTLLLSNLSRRCGFENPLSLTLLIVVGAAAFFGLVFLEFDQLLLVLIGVGLSFALQQPSSAAQQSTKKKSAQKRHRCTEDVPVSAPTFHKREPKLPVALPISRPRLMSTDFGGQVQELVAQITPGPASDLIVERLRAHVAAMIAPVFPSAHIVAVVFGDISSRTAFGQAEPEVNIVAHVDLSELDAWLGEGGGSPGRGPPARNPRKAALQGCLTPLIQRGGFKFRRLVTSGKSKEPKATLIAPPCVHGGCGENVAVCFAVNGSTPERHAAVVTDCARMCNFTKPLILLVKHWARNRSLCHANALSPYAWALLVVHFLQVGGCPFIPPLRCTGGSAPRLVPCDGALVEDAVGASGRDVGDLFAEFVAFFASFPWGEEVVSLRGSTASGATRVALSEAAAGYVAPTVEDPFEPWKNVAEDIRPPLVAHLYKELLRAHSLLSSGASLEVLTEPWEPPALAGST